MEPWLEQYFRVLFFEVHFLYGSQKLIGLFHLNHFIKIFQRSTQKWMSTGPVLQAVADLHFQLLSHFSHSRSVIRKNQNFDDWTNCCLSEQLFKIFVWNLEWEKNEFRATTANMSNPWMTTVHCPVRAICKCDFGYDGDGVDRS